MSQAKEATMTVVWETPTIVASSTTTVSTSKDEALRLAKVEAENRNKIGRARDVFCEGPLLEAVQAAELFPDCKTFVDMPMRQDPAAILAAFAALSDEDKRNKDKLMTFVQTHFDEAGSDIVPILPADFVPDPDFLRLISDDRKRRWARSIHGLWSHLVRQAVGNVLLNPERHSLLPRRCPVVVPGGRFRESYYWDTFWTIRGLLVSGMLETARGAVFNFLDDINRFGFIPNGGRIYYTERSQPPLLSDMICDVYAARPDAALLVRALPCLEIEHAFWMDFQRGRAVVTQAPPPKTRNASASSQGSSPEGGAVLLNRYWGALDPPIGTEDGAGGMIGGPRDSRPPRPESWREDSAAAGGRCACGSGERQAKSQGGNGNAPFSGLCHDLAAAAESGWDFSSRWAGAAARAEFESEDGLGLGTAENGDQVVGEQRSRREGTRGSVDEGTGQGFVGRKQAFCLSSTATTSVVPVDLNAFMHRAELNIARLHHARQLCTRGSSGVRKSTQEIVEDDARGRVSSAPALLSLDEIQQMYLFRNRERATNAGRYGTPQEGEDETAPAAGGSTMAVTAASSSGGDDLLCAKAILFLGAARARAAAMEETMWDEESGMWRDLLLPTGEQSPSVTPACFVPLWAGLPWPRQARESNGKRLHRCVDALRNSGLIQSGGVCTSSEDTGEQWDGDNAWPPLQWFIIRGLRRAADSALSSVGDERLSVAWSDTDEERRSNDRRAPEQLEGVNVAGEGTPERYPGSHELYRAGNTANAESMSAEGDNILSAVQAARDLADEVEKAFLEGALEGWERSGVMFEKYNARRVGGGGTGGEYDLQVGFGWTNGVALDLLAGPSTQ